LRQIAGVLPSRRAASRTAADTCVMPTVPSNARSMFATYTVPFHVRKSFAVTSRPVISCRYPFTSAEPTLCVAPLSSSRYWKSSCPGSSRQRRTMRASFGSSSRAMRWNLPPLPLNWNSMREPRTFTCRLRSVVMPKESFSSA